MHHRDRCLYRCKVTDANGNVVYSEPGEILTGQIVWDFSYDANGMRTKRTNGTTYEYVYNGSSLSFMSVDGNTLYFSYGADGDPVCVLYNGLKYFYATNLQGDVTAILDRTGNAVVEYTYDAWGNILTTSGTMADTLGAHNPLRYRGYVYDQETGLYYLQSRYYDPQVGRFINADAFVSTGQGLLGNNMFAYCNNNPTNYSDTTGCFPWHILLGAILGGGISAFASLINGGSLVDAFWGGLDGAVVGALIAAYPQLAIIVTSYDLCAQFFDCLYAGYSIEETIAVIGLSATAEYVFPSTGDDLTDTLVDSTFGTAIDITSEVGKKIVDDNNPESVDERSVTSRIVNCIICGGPAGGAFGIVTNAYGLDNLGIWGIL